MVYTLAHGARNYNTHLHYSLYGGVEYFPDKTLALKELLPLAAVPAIAITLLVAIINFHIPKLAPQQGSAKTGATTASGQTSSLILSAGSGSSSSASSGASNSTVNGKAITISPNATLIPSTTIGPISTGNDNGQGMLVGTGGDGGSSGGSGSTSTPSTSVTVTTPAGSAGANTNVTTQPTAPQAGVDVTTPVVSTSASLSL